MTLPAPTILVALNPETVYFTRTDNRHSHGPIGVNLASLADKGYMGACHELGNLTARILANAHPEVFAAYPALVPPSTTNDPLTLAYSLIRLSQEHHTQEYIGAIDALSKRISDRVFAETWNERRRLLMRTIVG